MRVLVTGGAGFIGSHLCARLVEDGHQVVCADDLSLGKKEHVAGLLKNPLFTFSKTDVSDGVKLAALFKKHSFEAVFHMAANSDIAAGGEQPGLDLGKTFLTTFCVLETMRRFGTRQIIFASSSAVYGAHDRPLAEDSGPLFPLSFYGAAKLASEGYISAFCENADMRAWIVRFPNVIGPRATHGVIYDFVKKLRANPRRLEILGNGRQCKPYLYVTDLVDAIILVWQRGKERINCYNAGAQTSTTVTRIARAAVAAMGLKNVRFEYTGGAKGWKGDVPRFAYSLEKIHALGWRASRTSDEAVALAARAIAGEVS